MNLRPNFFLVGAPKCGTSAMCHYLARHPEVFLSVPEEPGYFDGPLRFTRDRDYQFSTLDEYLRLFKAARPGHHKMVGEGSVYIMYTPGAVRRILALNPDARFLVMLRNPVDAVISMHGQNLKSPMLGREPCIRVEDAWADLPQRGEKRAIAGVHPFKFRYDVLFRYSEPVKNLLATIPAGRLKIVIYDDFAKDNIAVFRDVCAFLDIATDCPPRPVRVNERSQSRQNLAAVLFGLAAIAGRRLPLLRRFRGRGLMLNRYTQKPLSRPVLSDEFHRTLNRFFADDVETLRSVTGHDLAAWPGRAARHRPRSRVHTAAG